MKKNKHFVCLVILYLLCPVQSRTIVSSNITIIYCFLICRMRNNIVGRMAMCTSRKTLYIFGLCLVICSPTFYMFTSMVERNADLYPQGVFRFDNWLFHGCFTHVCLVRLHGCVFGVSLHLSYTLVVCVFVCFACWSQRAITKARLIGIEN